MSAKNEKRTMRTMEILCHGEHSWRTPPDPDNAARIELVKVIFSNERRARDLLKFCYLKDGRHARTHLTIDPEEFVELFQSAVEAGVFPADVLKELFKVLKKSQS
jgi:hypothetical protein